MTEPAEPISVAEPGEPMPAAEPAEPAAEDDVELPHTIEAAKKLRNECARLRIQNRELKDANAELEGAATRLAALEHAEVERIAAQDLIDPSDVWRAQPDLQSYYDDEFAQIVPDKVREATAALIAAKPHLARPNTAPPPSQRPIEGLRGGASPEPKKTEVTWSSALRRSI